MVGFTMSNAAVEIAELRAPLAASEARATIAEAELAQARALASGTEALIKSLRLEIAKLRREQYGKTSERRSRLIDQLELQLEELEATATEDAIKAEETAQTTQVRAFPRRKPARKAFPEHLPRERVVIEAPSNCTCCGSDRIAKMGEDAIRRISPRHWRSSPGSGRWSRRSGRSSPAGNARRSASRPRLSIRHPGDGPGRACWP